MGWRVLKQGGVPAQDILRQLTKVYERVHGDSLDLWQGEKLKGAWEGKDTVL
jgi:hypothetical protein